MWLVASTVIVAATGFVMSGVDGGDVSLRSHAEDPAASTEISRFPFQLDRRRTELSGTILESVPAGPYHYIALEHESTKRWIALMGEHPRMGQCVAVTIYGSMDDYRSQRTGKHFDVLYFGRLAQAAACS